MIRITPELKEFVLAQFTCQGCGACCKRPGYVYVTDAEAQAIAKELNFSLPQFQAHYIQRDSSGLQLIATPEYHAACFLRNDNTCAIYKTRPVGCRTFPNWGVIWQSESELQHEMTMCPALHQAVSSFRT